ncbi:MAG: uracil-DNA glycosylase, partial [Anaerolineae bacterium]|nr:uracil-DNA glycosylase [Anaerolineae bacterium]
MSDAYEQLLQAAIRHVEELRAQGVRFVAVSQDTLDALSRPRPARPAPVSPARPRQDAATARPTSQLAPSQGAGPLDLALGLPVETAAAPTAPPLDPAARAAALADLRTRVLACIKCPHLA